MSMMPSAIPAKPAPRFSVIIPAFNEADSIEGTIWAARASTAQPEIVVVDAGSEDGTPEIAEHLGATVIRTHHRQRAAQLNLGAEKARGSLLVFLHADTLLPPNALDDIAVALRDRRVVGGAFTRRYDSESLTLGLTCWLASLRNRMIGWHLGDQAMFVRGKVFDQMGGFHEVDRFEDLDLSRRLRRIGRTVTLEPGVVSSARRFERGGPLVRSVCDFVLTLRYLMFGLENVGHVGSSAAEEPLGGAREAVSGR